MTTFEDVLANTVIEGYANPEQIEGLLEEIYSSPDGKALFS